MVVQSAAQDFVAAFRAHIHDTLVPKIQAALDEQRLADEAMQQRWKGCNMAGVSWPSSSFSVRSHGDAFHFNMPAKLATEGNRAQVEAALAAAEAATGLTFDGTRVRGGSNFVLDGRLRPTRAPTPGSAG